MPELFRLLEMLGTAAFAVCGAMVAIDRGADIFGVVFLGATNAIGGGILRDSLLGRLPPVSFTDPVILVLAVGCPLVVFGAAWAAGQRYVRGRATVDTVNNLVDALGLGAFTVAGVRAGLAAATPLPWFFVLFLGLITGVGGGVLRDVMTGSTPFVLKKRVYALASIAGAAAYLGMEALGVPSGLGGWLAVALVFCVRLAATLLHWNLPHLPDAARK